MLILVGTLAPERMAAFTQGQTVYKACRFLQRHILARFAALEDAGMRGAVMRAVDATLS